MKYRKKRAIIDAWPAGELIDAARYDWRALPGAIKERYDANGLLFLPDGIIIHTLEGQMRANRDDMLIMGVLGDLYPCRADVFAATYDPVAEDQR